MAWERKKGVGQGGGREGVGWGGGGGGIVTTKKKNKTIIKKTINENVRA